MSYWQAVQDEENKDEEDEEDALAFYEFALIQGKVLFLNKLKYHHESNLRIGF